jgi:hypothetical protein
MSFESEKVEGQPDAAAEGRTCPSCHASMPLEMRFCRLCGYRLGEGLAEYTETVRFQQPPVAQANMAGPRAIVRDGGRLNPAYQPSARLNRPSCTRGNLPHWIIWPMIGILVASIAGAISKPFRSRRSAPQVRSFQPPPPPQPALPFPSESSFLGADGFEEANGGVTFDYVTPPGSAADKAGLVGGDIITSFDGKSVTDVGQMMDILEHTPAGKTVEVVYLRDGEIKTTKLTTLPEDRNEHLEELFEERPEGMGYIGEGTDLERVRVPGTNFFGVRLGEIRPNRPADISGLRNGDIIIEFDGTPTRTRQELESRIQRALPGSTVKAFVMRGTERVEVPVRIGRED